MEDQAQRLEVATAKAMAGGDIVYRFTNDPVTGEPIPTESGDIQNLQQIVANINSMAADAFKTALSMISPVDGPALYDFLDELGFVWGSIFLDGIDLPGFAVTKKPENGTTIQDAEGFVIMEDSPDGTSLGPLTMCKIPGPGLLVIDELGFVWNDLLAPLLPAPVVPEPEPEPKIPSTIPLLAGPICSVAGLPTSIYVRNVLEVRSDTNLVRGTIASRSSPETITSTDEIRFSPESIGAQAYLYMRSDLSSASRTRLTLNCQTAPNPGAGSGYILTLGDSIQNRQGGQMQKQYLNEWGYTPTFIGTIKGSADTANNDNDGGELGEAREGWETGDFTYSVTDRVSIVAPGGEDDYKNLPKLSKWNINPFLRAATGSDPAGIVRNGMVFDPADYQARFGLPTPTIVNITLGTNNVRDRSEAEIAANYHSDMTLIVNQCRAAWPLAKIVLSCPGTPRDVIRDALWQTKYVPLLRSMLQVRNDFDDANVIVFSAWAHVSQEAGYTITAPEVDPLTGAVTGATGDGIHPRESTRMQMHQAYAKMFACAMANLI